MKIIFRVVKLFFSEENTSTICFSKWGYFLASTILASFFAKIAYLAFDVPQQYSELIVGNIAWSYSNKFHDYAVLFSFVGVFFCFARNNFRHVGSVREKNRERGGK